MAAYVVMEPPAGSGRDRVADVTFVRDRFSLLAFLFPPLWLAVHRAWFAAVMALLAGIVLGTVAERAGLGTAGVLLSLLVSIYVGLEGPGLWLASLRRRGWREVAVVEADSVAEAEIRFFSEAGSVEPAIVPAAVSTAPARPASGPALGLFAYPGRA